VVTSVPAVHAPCLIDRGTSRRSPAAGQADDQALLASIGSLKVRAARLAGWLAGPRGLIMTLLMGNRPQRQLPQDPARRGARLSRARAGQAPTSPQGIRACRRCLRRPGCPAFRGSVGGTPFVHWLAVLTSFTCLGTGRQPFRCPPDSGGFQLVWHRHRQQPFCYTRRRVVPCRRVGR
jgi:hypothetical protein